jgi:hypothetical protein
MAEKTCNNCSAHEETSFAMELLHQAKQNGKRWFIISVVSLVMWLSTIAGFIWFLFQYDFEICNISSDGNAYYQKQIEGDINNNGSDLRQNND